MSTTLTSTTASETSLPILSPEDVDEICENAHRVGWEEERLEKLLARITEAEEAHCTEEDFYSPSPAYSGPGRRDPFNNTRRAGLPNIDDYDKMRQSADPNSFGRIVGPRSYRGRLMPPWAMNDKKVQRLLLSTFPRMKEDSAAGRRQRDSAARWYAVIHLYFKMKYTCSDIAKELGSSNCKIRNVVRSIQRVARGLRADSRKPRTNSRGANLRGPQHPRKSKG